MPTRRWQTEVVECRKKKKERIQFLNFMKKVNQSKRFLTFWILISRLSGKSQTVISEVADEYE
jgi:hypothetical protein